MPCISQSLDFRTVDEGVPSISGSDSPAPAALGARAAICSTKIAASLRAFLGRFAIPLFAVLAAFAFIALATVRWDDWVGGAAVQSTNDAYIRAD